MKHVNVKIANLAVLLNRNAFASSVKILGLKIDSNPCEIAFRVSKIILTSFMNKTFYTFS